MATSPSPDCDLLSIPFSAATDFTILTAHGDRFAQTLIECHNPALKMALCGRLNTCLALLRPTLNAPHWIRTADGVQVIDGRPA
ncbi:hypothetical protein K3115_004710 [Escherichia coli]|nr:hypothetical protein [Escherichia coli]EHX7311710.1 hypothetical protein [Escherichia coli]